MIAMQTLLNVLLVMALATGVYQQPTPAPTTTPSPVIVPTSPASATTAALFATSAALSATTQALLSHPTSGPAGQTPRQLPNSGGEDMPWGALAGLLLLLFVAGAWLRHRATIR
jgi:LPXTG-motif cell wall-anchored protein